MFFVGKEKAADDSVDITPTATTKESTNLDATTPTSQTSKRLDASRRPLVSFFMN